MNRMVLLNKKNIQNFCISKIRLLKYVVKVLVVMKIRIGILLFFVFINFCSLLSQEKVTPHLDFTYLKKTDGSRLLKANLYIFQNKIVYPIIGSNISFSIGFTEQKINIVTNAEGIAYLVIGNKTKVTTDIKGIARYIARYSGKDTIDSISSEILVKDSFIGLSLSVIDTVRTIVAQLRDLTSKGDTAAVSGVSISFYVPRMFSNLKIGEETTDTAGMVTMEFPNDLPGNPDSTIMVYARLDENEIYNNVEVFKIARWGEPAIHRIPESHRTLWTQIAPLWMIISLSVMLLGVWGHYIFVIIQLILIKKENTNKNKESLV